MAGWWLRVGCGGLQAVAVVVGMGWDGRKSHPNPYGGSCLWWFAWLVGCGWLVVVGGGGCWACNNIQLSRNSLLFCGILLFMPSSMFAYPDVVVREMPNPDDARLHRVHKKGFSAFIKSANPEVVDEWAGLYPAWYLKKLHRLVVFWSSKLKKVRVALPKLRSHRSDHYAWVKWVPLPENGYWYLLTLTLYRSYGLQVSWRDINRWTSKFLHRFRVYLKKQFGREVEYMAVVETHKDGYPHVHILFTMPYIQELNFRRLLSLFQSYWVDDEGRPLCAPQGVDLEYIGRDVRQVREYVVKYLVKDHHKHWYFEMLPDGRVKYRLSTVYKWLYKTRLLIISQGIRKRLRELMEKRKAEGGSPDWIFYGYTPANRVHKLFYKPLGIPFEYWLSNLPDVCFMEFPDKHLPELVPSAFSSRGSPSDDVYDELIENF